jgi:acyl carrier protein
VRSPAAAATLARVNHRNGVAEVVLDLVVAACPRVSRAGLRDETHLDREGLGLDSIEIVEVLLSCEERYGKPVEALLDGAPLTFGRVVDHFCAA